MLEPKHIVKFGTLVSTEALALKLPPLNNLKSQKIIIKPLPDLYQHENQNYNYTKNVNTHKSSEIKSPKYSSLNTENTFGLPAIVQKTKKNQMVNFTPTLTKRNLIINMNNSNDDNKMKKNISNKVNFEIIKDIINTPQEAQSIEEDNSKEKKQKKKKKIKK